MEFWFCILLYAPLASNKSNLFIVVYNFMIFFINFVTWYVLKIGYVLWKLIWKWGVSIHACQMVSVTIIGKGKIHMLWHMVIMKSISRWAMSKGIWWRMQYMINISPKSNSVSCVPWRKFAVIERIQGEYIERTPPTGIWVWQRRILGCRTSSKIVSSGISGNASLGRGSSRCSSSQSLVSSISILRTTDTTRSSPTAIVAMVEFAKKLRTRVAT